MKKRLLIIFVFIVLRSISQTLIIDDNIVLNRGIYKNFEEFKFNSPSIPLNYKIDTVEYNNIDAYTPARNHITYRILLKKSEAKQIGPVFGFCDGKYIYINESNVYLGEKSDFELLKFVGLYSYFEQYMFVQGELGTPSSNTILYKIVNINNGEVSILTQDLAKKIFANDSDILNRYDKENDKKLTLKDYIAMYSLKHKIDGVYCRDKKMTKSEADSFIVRRKTDFPDSVYYNRLASKLMTNMAFSDAKLEEQFYENGKRKSIGFNIRCNFDPNDQFLHCIGLWEFYYETGQLKEELYYSISSKLLSKKRFDINGNLITK